MKCPKDGDILFEKINKFIKNTNPQDDIALATYATINEPNVAKYLFGKPNVDLTNGSIVIGDDGIIKRANDSSSIELNIFGAIPWSNTKQIEKFLSAHKDRHGRNYFSVKDGTLFINRQSDKVPYPERIRNIVIAKRIIDNINERFNNAPVSYVRFTPKEKTEYNKYNLPAYRIEFGDFNLTKAEKVRTLLESNKIKRGDLISLSEARKLAKELMPNIKDEEVVFLHRILLNELAGAPVYGLYKNYSVYVQKENLKGKEYIRENVLRHEIFHKIFNEYLTEKERLDLIKSLAKEYPNKNINLENYNLVEIEEFLAEKFQVYKNDSSLVSSTLRKLFNKIMKFFGFINKNTDNIEKFFRLINEGYFTENLKVSNSGFNENIQRNYIIENFESVDKFKSIAYQTLKMFNERYSKPFKGYPLTKKEAFAVFKQEILVQYKRVKPIYDELISKLQSEEILNADEKRKLLISETFIKLNDEKNLKIIMEYLYPNYDFNNFKFVDLVDEQDETNSIESIIEAVNLSEYMENDPTTDRERKSSAVIKDFLSGITFNESIVDSRAAYFILLKALKNFVVDSKGDLTEQLIDRFSKFTSNPTFKAVADKLISYSNELYNRVYIKDDTFVNLPENTKFLSDDLFVINLDNKSIVGETKSKLTNSKVNKLVYRRSNETTVEFFNRILENNPTLSIDIINGLYYHHRKGSQFAEVMSHFSSQYESNMQIIDNSSRGSSVASFVGMSSNEIKLSGKIGIANKILNFFSEEDGVYTKEKTKDKLKEFKNVIKLTEPSSSISDKLKGVKEFLSLLGLNDESQNVNILFNDQVSNNIYYFLTNHLNKVGDKKKLKVTKENALLNTEISDEIEDDIVTPQDILDREGNSLLNSLAELTEGLAIESRPTSLTNANGDRVFTFRNSSHGREVLETFMDQTKSSVKNEIYTKEFFKFNPFVNNKNRIFKIIDSDSIRKKYTVIPYSKENEKDWLDRVLNAGFIDSLHGQSNKLNYIQFTYTPSNRPNISGAEINLVYGKELKETIKNIIYQLQSRNKNSYFKTHNPDKFINAKEIEKALLSNKLKLSEVNKDNIDKIVNEVLSNFESIANDLIIKIQSQSIPLHEKLPGVINKLISNEIIKGESFEFNNKKSLNEDGNTVYSAEQLLPFMTLFIANQYVNSYYLNQLVVGDYASFKNGKDVLKRLQGVFAPGYKLFIHPEFGARENFKAAILKDESRGKENIKDFLSNMFVGKKYDEINLETEIDKNAKIEIDKILLLFGDSYEPTDAQGFMLPSRQEEISRALGESFNTKNILKPAHYEIADIQNTVTAVMLKYSSVVLTEELTKKFPRLGKLAEKMVKAGIDEVVFDSGTKAGAPAKKYSFDEINTDEFEFSNDDILTLKNSEYRIQHNPAHHVDGDVALPTQLSYFLNVLKNENNNVGNADQLYEALSELINSGQDEFFNKMDNNLKTLLLDISKGQGSEKVNELLKAGVSHNFPLIFKKVFSQLAANISKKTVNQRLPGSKLVLQSAVGIDLTQDNAIPERFKSSKLEFRTDEEGRLYAEALLPKHYKKYIKSGDFIYNADMFGFRIPSTELHSAVPIRVVGFYDNEDSNIIVVPEELVPLHGSDFDVDALFVIRREYDNQNNPVGYEKNKQGLWEFNRTLDIKDKVLLEKYRKNKIFDAFISAITHKRNLDRMLSPISFAMFNDISNPNSVFSHLNNILGNLNSQDLDLSNPLDNLAAFRSNMDGAALTGVFANNIKALSYMIRANEGELPILKPQIPRPIINGKEFSGLTDTKELWQTLDGLLNASIDNVKEQILPAINANGFTANALTASLALGIDLNDSVSLMVHPAIKELSLYDTKNKAIAEVRDIILTNLKSILTKEEYESLNENKINLNIHYVNKTASSSFVQLLNSNNKEELIELFNVIKTFEILNSLGEDIANMSSALGILKTFPSDFVSLQNTLKKFKTFGELNIEDNSFTENDSFSFSIPSFYEKNPHIKEAYKTLLSFDKKIRSTFYQFDNNIDDFINSLNLKINLVFNNSSENKEEIRKELINFLLSSLYDFSNEKPYKLKGRNSFRYNQKAFNERFIDDVEKVKNINASNRFLKGVSIKTNKYGERYLTFNGGSNLKYTDIVDIEDAFESLGIKGGVYNNFQRDFVKYAVLNFGFNFGSSNYSQFLPSSLIKEVSDKIDERIKPVALSQKQLFNIKEFFEISLVQNFYADVAFNKNFPKVSSELIKFNEVTKIDGREIRADLLVNNKGGKLTDSDLPKFQVYTYYAIEPGESDSYGVYIRTTDVIDGDVVYTKLYNLNKNKLYSLTNKILKDGYSIDEAFRSDVEIFKSENFQENKLQIEVINKEKIKSLKPGNVIALVHKSDSLNVEKRYVEIKSINVTKEEKKLFGSREVLQYTIELEVENTIMLPISNTDLVGISEVDSRTIVDSFKEGDALSIFKEDEEIKLTDMINLLIKNSKNSFTKAFLIYIKDRNLISPEQIIKFEYLKGSKGKVKLGSRTKNKIAINTTDLHNREETFIHEFIHELTVDIIKKIESGEIKDEKAKAALKNLRFLYTKSKAVAKERGINYYGFSNIYEFIAEAFSNQEFQTFLNSLDAIKSSKSLFEQFIDLIIDILGVNKGSVLAETINQTIKLINIEIPSETSKIDVNEEFNKEIDEIDSSWQNIKEDDKDKNFYILNGKRYKRVTTVINDFRSGDNNTPLEERRADALWQNGKISKDSKLVTDIGGQTLNYEEYKQALKARFDDAILKGDIIHAIIEYNLINDPIKKEKLADEIRDKSEQLGGFFRFGWVTENIQNIIENSDINIYKKLPNGNPLPDEMKDKIKTEFSIGSEELGIAGTIDVLVEHPDKTFSIIDWKTGAKFNNQYVFSDLIKFAGKNFDINDTPRNRAKLQIMLYAFLLKVNKPDARFKNLKAIWLASEVHAKNKDNQASVEVVDYLAAIEAYFSQKAVDPNTGKTFEQLKKQILKTSPNAFNPSEYISLPRNVLEEKEESGLSNLELLEKKKAKLQILVNQYTDENRPVQNKEQISKLTKDILMLESSAKSNFEEDSLNIISGTTRWLGTLDDTNSPIIQAYRESWNRSKESAQREFDYKMNKFRKLLLPVYNDYLKRKGLSAVKSLTANKFVPINYEELYGKFWKERNNGDYYYRDFVTSSDSEWNSLSENEKRLMTYIQHEFASYFDKNGVMNKVITKENGYNKTVLDIFNKNKKQPFVYNSSFAPRIPITKEEIGFRQLFTADGLKLALAKRFSSFLDDAYEGHDQEEYGLPVKYLGNAYVNSSDNYTKNLEIIFDKFSRSMINKRHMDDIYSLGRGIQYFLRLRENRQPMFKNTIGFIDDHMTMGLLNKRKDLTWMRRKIQIGTLKSKDGIELPFHLDFGRILLGLKSAVSAPIMWLKPIQGTRNGIFISMITAKDSIKGSISENIFGVDGSNVDFGVTDLAWAEKEYLKMVADQATGKLRQNKTFLLAKKFRYLPDNFDWATNSSDLLTTKNKIISESSMYMFHTIPEEWTSYLIMLAQLRRMKHNKTGNSIFDSYEVRQFKNRDNDTFKIDENGEPIYEVVWAAPSRGRIKKLGSENEYEDLNELNFNEINKLKKVYTRMHGGYRQEDRSAIEAYTLGKVALQFRKFMPQILLTAFKSSGEDSSLGKYVQTGTLENGDAVMEWVSRMNEGRMLVIGKTLANYISALLFWRNKRAFSDYSWENLPDEKKQHIIDGSTTLILYLAMIAGWISVFGDDDDDDSLKKHSRYVIDNFAQQYDPKDMLKNFEKTGVVVTKSLSTYKNLLEVAYSTGMLGLGYEDIALTRDGRLRGSASLIRDTPFAASLYDIIRFNENLSDKKIDDLIGTKDMVKLR